jgi:Family of unknown function (DUF5317)
MLIGVALLVCLATVPAAGGSWERLSRLTFAAPRAILAAITLQVIIVSLLPGGAPWLHNLLHIASYAPAAWFVWANRRLAGVPLMALGGALNLAAITANGGVMPASRQALAHAGLPADTGEFANSAVVAHPHVPWLGDVFATPAALPIANVFSVGDVLLVAGALVALHVASGSRLGRYAGPRSASASRNVPSRTPDRATAARTSAWHSASSSRRRSAP